MIVNADDNDGDDNFDGGNLNIDDWQSCSR